MLYLWGSYWNPEAELPNTAIPSAHTTGGKEEEFRAKPRFPSLISCQDLPCVKNQRVWEFVGAAHSLGTKDEEVKGDC